jgi:hypothetical protein
LILHLIHTQRCRNINTLKKLLLGIALSVAALTPVLADGYGWNGDEYVQWYNTREGGYGWHGHQYYQWHNTRDGGEGWDGNEYFQWHDNGGK